MARGSRPDAITLDVMMPQMDGWSVLSAFKADPELSDIPVTIITMLNDRGVALSLGAADFLTKPIDWQRLVTLLQHAIKAARDRCCWSRTIPSREMTRDSSSAWA